MPTRDGDRIVEDIQTNTALELILNHPGKLHCYFWKKRTLYYSNMHIRVKFLHHLLHKVMK